mgnify:CR=1 FL=1
MAETPNPRLQVGFTYKSRKGKDMKNYITGSRYGQELADLRKSQGVPKSERNQLKKEEQIAKRK